MVDQRQKLILLPTDRKVLLSEVGEVINKNYTQYNVTAEQLFDLQQWIKKQQELGKE